MRKLQIVWSGPINYNRTKIHITDTIGIIDTMLTPISSVEHGLKLLTASGDTVLPCTQCIKEKITETISYASLTVSQSCGNVVLNVVVCIMCNGCSGHVSGNDYTIVFYTDESTT